jgi:hypothetical protein
MAIGRRVDIRAQLPLKTLRGEGTPFETDSLFLSVFIC